jgi:CheY-like chemotaxis protein
MHSIEPSRLHSMVHVGPQRTIHAKKGKRTETQEQPTNENFVSKSDQELDVPIPVRVARLPIPSAPQLDTSSKAIASIRILIVDDNRDSVTTLTILLRQLGHQTRGAFDGEEAVAAAREFQPQVVLLDIGLPKLNGYEVCRWIRAQNQTEVVTIIAQTGWGQEETRQKTSVAGFDHHLVKPLNPNALRKIIEKLAGRSQQK